MSGRDSPPDAQPPLPQPPGPPRQRIEELASRYFDQALTPQEEGELAAALRSSAQARALFRELARVEGATALLVSTGLPAALIRRRSPRWWWPAMAAAAVVAMAAGALVWAMRAAPSAAPPGDLARQPVPAAPLIGSADLPTLSATADGAAIMVGSGPSTGVNAVSAMPTMRVQPGEQLAAGALITATTALDLGWRDGTHLHLDAGTCLEIGDPGAGKRLLLRSGGMHAEVAPQPAAAPLLIDTPRSQARVVGTHFALASGEAGDRLDVSEGTVVLSSGTQSVTVTTAHAALAAPALGLQLLPQAAGGGALLAVPGPAQFASALALLRDGDTVQLAPGEYALHEPLVLDHLNRVTLTGEPGQAEHTVLRAVAGVTTCVDLLAASDCTISHLTLADADQHLVFCHADAGCQAPHLEDLILSGAQENFIRAIGPDPRLHVDRGVVDGCRFRCTRPLDPDGFVAYLDITGGQDWIVRGCTFEPMRFAGATHNSTASAILARGGAGGTLCERNRISGCLRGITLGAGGAPTSPDHRGGMVRDNMISRPPGMAGDCGISIANAPGTRVLFNTVLLSGTYPDAIEFRFPGTRDGEIADNLCDGAIDLRDDATATVQGNCTSAQAAWFQDPAAGDLHLTAAAAGAIPPGVEVTDDGGSFDGAARTSGTPPVPGADAPKP